MDGKTHIVHLGESVCSLITIRKYKLGLKCVRSPDIKIHLFSHELTCFIFDTCYFLFSGRNISYVQRCLYHLIVNIFTIVEKHALVTKEKAKKV